MAMISNLPRLSELTTTLKQHYGLIDSVRYLYALHATHGGEGGLAAAYYMKQWPDSQDRVVLMMKAAVPPVGTGDVTTPIYLRPLIEQMQQATVLARLPAVQVPLKIPIGVITAEPVLQWVAEGAPKPATKASIGNVTLAATKAAAITVHSEELAKMAAGAELVLANRLIAESTRFIDSMFLDPAITAIAGTRPASVTNGATNVPANAGGIDATLSDLVDAFFTQRPYALQPTFIVGPAGVAAISASGNHPQLSAGFLLGLPAVSTPGAGKVVALVDAQGIYANDQGAQIDQSQYAALQMDSAPDNPPTGSTVLVDLWATNQIGLRLDRYANWQREANAVAYAVLP